MVGRDWYLILCVLPKCHFPMAALYCSREFPIFLPCDLVMKDIKLKEKSCQEGLSPNYYRSLTAAAPLLSAPNKKQIKKLKETRWRGVRASNEVAR